MTKVINFYSTKRHGNVEIPVSKVCGVRIPNSYMKKNYSDGIRTGADNGVVNQRLSRFSTEAERKEATSNCAGNVNWLNYKVGETFNPPENAGRQFSIKRPAFDVGTVAMNRQEADSIDDINQRGGLGNKRIVRPSFMSPPLKPRITLEFDKLQLLNIQEAGENIKTTENKLSYTASIQIPDPTDFKWLREETRLRAVLTAQFRGYPPDEIPAMVERELSINKPFGRAQRTITSSTNDIASNDRMSVKNKLTKIIQDVADGRAESRPDQIRMTQQITDILQRTTEVERLSTLQLTGLGQALARIGVPSNYKRLGIIPRYVDNTFYNDNAGIINLLLFSKVREEPNTRLYNYDLIVKNFVSEPNGLPAVKLSTMLAQLGRGGARRYFLDLERGGVISQAQLRAVAGIDPRNGKANIRGSPDFAINPNLA
tara:strand:- start:4145 stop:5428 length:1284 start_codon:yes stop_codon:yes gene_type:complete